MILVQNTSFLPPPACNPSPLSNATIAFLAALWGLCAPPASLAHQSLLGHYLGCPVKFLKCHLCLDVVSKITQQCVTSCVIASLCNLCVWAECNSGFTCFFRSVLHHLSGHWTLLCAKKPLGAVLPRCSAHCCMGIPLLP